MLQSLVKLVRESILRLESGEFAARCNISAADLQARERAMGEDATANYGLTHAEVLKLAHMGDELLAVAALMNQLREEERVLAARDPYNSTDSPAVAQVIRAESAKKMAFLHELRTRAYGKVVVVRGLRDERIRLYRIAQANYGYPSLEYDAAPRGKLRLMLINRQSPHATQLVSAVVGEDVVLRSRDARGEWSAEPFRVIAVVDLERHFGNELLANYQNFKHFVLSHADLGTRVDAEDILRSFGAGVERIRAALKGAEAPAPASEPRRREVQRGDEERLGAHLYTRTTRLQESLLQRPSHGLVVVTGVAGSGKTSVALGRTKVLCDRTRDENEDEPDFFHSETAVGFVLSAQLSTYLQRACAQLALIDMPVHEYRQLREELITKRGLEEEGYQRGARSEGGASGRSRGRCPGCALLTPR
jgi:hypothetical protein